MISVNLLHCRVFLPLVLAAAISFHNAAVSAAVGDAAGGKLQVNTTTLLDQENPAVAMNAAGAFVVVWESIDSDTGDYGIYAQRYNADGTRLGGETQINNTLLNEQSSPKVAMNADGNFVAVWENIDQNGDINIYARRFDAAGTPSGSDFRINPSTISYATGGAVPGVGMDSAGNFIVVWESYDNTNGNDDIYARRFDSSGTALGAEFRVNSEIANDQMYPVVAMNAAGDFIAAWQSTAQDSDGSTGIYAQRYTAAGTALGGEFRVNTTIANDQTAVTAAMDTSGDAVVAWQSAAQDSDGSSGIYAQRYDATGMALGGEFRVNTEIANDQTAPAAAMNAAGDLVVTWESLAQDGDGQGIYAQRYDASGAPLGGEFRVNTAIANAQMLPAAAINTDLDMVVAWESYGQDDTRHPSYGIYAQRYLGNNVASSSATSSGSGGGGGGALDWLSAMVILPALRRRRHPMLTMR